MPGSSGCAFGDWTQSLQTLPVPLQVSGIPLDQAIALVNTTLQPAAAAAIANITAVRMIQSVASPLLAEVTAMLMNTKWQDPSVCSPSPPPQCADNFGRLDCCATAFSAGVPYPNASVWSKVAAAQASTLASLAPLAALLNATLSTNSITPQDLATVAGWVGNLSLMKAGGMRNASCTYQYNNHGIDCYEGSYNGNPNGYSCHYNGPSGTCASRYDPHYCIPNKCDNCQTCASYPDHCVNGGCGCKPNQYCPAPTAPIANTQAVATWPVSLM